jgi:chorismate-pyruvate lyase
MPESTTISDLKRFVAESNLQELSQDTLNRYKDKAIKQADKSVKRDIGWRRALHKTNATAPGKRVKVKASDSDWHANQQEKMKKMKKEGTDLQELSKKTLGSYINKSSEDMWRAGGRQQFHKDQANKASAKGGYKDPKVKQNRDAADREYNKAAKRQYGISLATHKLTKENTNLQELSDKLKRRYVIKATRDKSVSANTANIERGIRSNLTKPEYIKAKTQHIKNLDNKVRKRTAGLKLATHKLTKENTELQELSKKTLGSYVKKASAELDKDWADTKAGKSGGLSSKKITNRFHSMDLAKKKINREGQ